MNEIKQLYLALFKKEIFRVCVKNLRVSVSIYKREIVFMLYK